jgi:hypothetical protein
MMNSLLGRFCARIALVATLATTAITVSAEQEGGPCEADIELALHRLTFYPEMEEWSVTRTLNTIKLTSKFMVNTSPSQARVLDEGEPLPDPEEGQNPFEITLHFKPIGSFNAYKELVNTRETYADQLNRDMLFLEGEPLEDEAFTTAIEQLAANPLPTHAAGESLVTITTTLDDTELSIDPDTQMQKAIWMLHRVGFLFTEIVR